MTDAIAVPGSVSILSGASIVRIDGSPTFNAAGRDVNNVQVVNQYYGKPHVILHM
jgi:hypothetical protein